MLVSNQVHSNAAIGTDENSLHDIHLETKNIAIYQRDTVALQNELAHISEYPIECRASGTVDEIFDALKNCFNEHESRYPLLMDDVFELLKQFKRITKASSFRLLLTSVSTNMCRKFHTDINDLRLLCTYVGPGTLWLPDNAITNRAMFAGGEDPKFVIYESQIQQANTGDVVLLKGALYENAKPILHKSPAIEGTNGNRFLLRIDTNEFINSFA